MSGYKIFVRASAIGIAVILSACSLENSEPLSDEPGLSELLADAGPGWNGGGRGDGDRDNRRGGFDGGSGEASSGGQQTSDAGGSDSGLGITGGEEPDGPGNSDFGRGDHANAGGGNGSEFDGEGNEIDPGNSGNSRGQSRYND